LFWSALESLFLCGSQLIPAQLPYAEQTLALGFFYSLCAEFLNANSSQLSATLENATFSILLVLELSLN